MSVTHLQGASPSATALADIHTSGYHDLRRLAQENDPRARTEVAQQLEAYFFQQILKQMREASFGDSFFDSHASSTYREIFESHFETLSWERGLEGEAFLTEEILNELSGYSRDELLVGRICYLGRKPESRDHP